MSVRTAWEIAALEDVRLAPSPRQQRPAPGPVCAAGLLLTPPGPPAKDPGAADRRGAPHSWGRFSSALGCSVAFQPPATPPLLAGHRWAGAWVPLGSSLVPALAPALGTRAGAFALQQGQATPVPQPQAAEDTLGKSAGPFLPQGLRQAPRAGVATGPSRRGRGGGPGHTEPPSRA